MEINLLLIISAMCISDVNRQRKEVMPHAGLMLSTRPLIFKSKVSSASLTICNAFLPILSQRHRYCCQNRPFDLQGSQRQHGRLIRLPMLDHGAAFFRTGPEICRHCRYCCSPNWTCCPRYRSRNNDLSWDAEDVWWSYQVIPEGSRTRKGCFLAQNRLEPL